MDQNPNQSFKFTRVFTRTVLGASFFLVLAATPLRAAPACDNAAVLATDDYSWIIGSADFIGSNGSLESGSWFGWLVNGTNWLQGPIKEGLLLHFDGSPNGAGGEAPTLATNVGYANGAWGSALALGTSGTLRYASTNNLFLDEGTIEMWVALRDNGSAPRYTNQSQVLFLAQASSTNWMSIAQSSSSGIIYAGGVVNGQWESAYASGAIMSSWPSNQWHHLAYTFSTSNNFMRFYLDGRLVADTNERHYWPLPSTPGEFYIGGSSGTPAGYLIDEVRISGRAASSDEIAARAHRTHAPQANEVWMNTAALTPGSAVTFQYQPADGLQTGGVCSATFFFPGQPLTNAVPGSTLLPPGATNFLFSVQSITNTSCRYAVGSPLAFAQMTPFDAGAGTTTHQTQIKALNPDPNIINHVYIRCAAWPDYLLDLRYRCLSPVNPPFPRTGNLWGWWNFVGKGLPYMARIDLWLGADGLSADQIAQLHTLNTNLHVLTSINTVENSGLPDDYYLKDIHGNKIEVWPGTYRLNLTKKYVAEYQANYAYQSWLNSGCQADGVFFDNVFTTQSWLKTDIYGNALQIDANGDGIADDPATLDAAWKAGVYHELETFRALMPYALMSGHAMDINDPEIASLFNGISVGFQTANVIEGKQTFGAVWNNYSAWCTQARAPQGTMIESSPISDIGYGYDYDPLNKAPTNTVAFAQNYYPWMRFGLAFTLLNDGYFAHEWGDTAHGQDWWYDELNYNLGYPLGPAACLGQPGATNGIVNGDFETAIVSPWTFSADGANGYTGSVAQVTGTAPSGTACARINIDATAGTDWRIGLVQNNRSLVAGVTYELVFWAKASLNRPLTLGAQKGSPDWRTYGLWNVITITTNWAEYSVRFTANETVNDSRIQFLVGATNGQVWLDNVRLREPAPDLYRREFDNGLVLLNATRQTQTINLGYGFRRLTGTQAARYEYIIDDNDPAFSTNGSWTVVTCDSGQWKASGPFYHDWGTNCHQSAAADAAARWALTTPTNDTYTIEAWWPAAPTNQWSTNVLYEVLASNVVVASAALSQRTNGDQWYGVATVALPGGTNNVVRAHALDGSVWIADALHVRGAVRYNDGSSAPTVTLQPMDGIVLQREPGTYADRDQDGLPDFWELQYFGNVTNADPNADPNGNGLSNLQEWIAGTNPTNRGSAFLMVNPRPLPAPAGFRFAWPSLSNRVYDLLGTTNLAAGFSVLATNLPVTPPLNLYTDSVHTGSPQYYYRVRVNLVNP